MVFVSWYIFNREDFVEKKIPSRWNFKFFIIIIFLLVVGGAAFFFPLPFTREMEREKHA